MKITKVVHVPAHDVEQEVCRRCDFPDCGKDTDRVGYYKVNECDVRVYVKHREGTNFPDGGEGDEIEIDVCPECFKTKLIPWLESQGVRVEKRKWVW